MQDLKEFEETVNKYLPVRTPPVAIKLLKSDKDIPPGVPRPKKDLGHRVALCQGIAFARRNGVALAMLKEDMYCPLGIIVLGLMEPHPFFLEGDTALGRYARTREAAARIAQEHPRFSVGEYIGVVTSPLPSTALGDRQVSLLHSGSPEQIRALTRELIDVVGEGGGFVMGTSSSMAEADPELVKVWVDSTRDYGVY